MSIIGLRRLTLFGSWSEGVWGYTTGKWCGVVKAPWNAPLFSERYGYERFAPLGFGWRCQFRRVRREGP